MLRAPWRSPLLPRQCLWHWSTSQGVRLAQAARGAQDTSIRCARFRRRCSRAPRMFRRRSSYQTTAAASMSMICQRTPAQPIRRRPRRSLPPCQVRAVSRALLRDATLAAAVPPLFFVALLCRIAGGSTAEPWWKRTTASTTAAANLCGTRGCARGRRSACCATPLTPSTASASLAHRRGWHYDLGHDDDISGVSVDVEDEIFSVAHTRSQASQEDTKEARFGLQ